MKFIFNLLFNMWFYVGIVGVLAVMYFFPWLSIGSRELPTLPGVHFATTKATEKIYVPKRTISNLIIGITYANVTIGQNQHRDSWSKNIDFDNDFEAMIETKNTITEMLNRDFVQMMDNSSDKEKTLQNFINTLENLIQQANSIYDTSAAKVRDWQISYDSCTANKEAADAAYLNAINQSDSNNVQGFIDEAEQYGQCQTNFRIKINSYTLPLSELWNARDAAAAYTTVLNDRFSTLVQYYELLRSDVLDELILTKQQFWL